MRKILFLISFLCFAGLNYKAHAQNFDNLAALVAEGYTLDEMKDIVDNVTTTNHTSYLKTKGYAYKGYDAGKNEYYYDKNEFVSLVLTIKNSKPFSIRMLSSPQKFYKAAAEFKSNSKYKLYSSEDIDEGGTLAYYDFGDYSYAMNTKYYRMTLWFPEKKSTNSTSPTATTTKTTSSNINSDYYYSAKEIADAMNARIDSAIIGYSTDKYRISVHGTMDLDRRSMRFITKENVLYLQLNIPRNGDCDYGLKEIKARLIGPQRRGSDYFYFSFDYLYKCQGKVYSCVVVYFHPNEGFNYDGLRAWFDKNLK